MIRVFFAAVVCILLFFASFQVFETVGAGEIVVKQGAIDGKLTVWTTPGVQAQNFGRITRYTKSTQFWFNKPATVVDGGPADDSIKVRFNDGGHAQLSGSLRYDLPLDPIHLAKLHATFGSQDAIDKELIKQIVTKAVYMTGPLMSSKESNAERRPDLIHFIEDQVAHGVYRTITRQVKMPDPISGQEKTVAVVEIVTDPKAVENLARQEISPIEVYGVRTTNLTISSIDYEADVEAQIKAQQKALMDVQTAQVDSKKAEQRALTVAKEGEAEAAKAKWIQEAIKAKAVTAAEQERDVAALNLETAKLDKQAMITTGEGQAEKAKLLMSANGALEQKLETYRYVMDKAFSNLGRQPLVPSIVINSGSGGGAPASTDIMNMLQVKMARDLGLNMSMPDSK